MQPVVRRKHLPCKERKGFQTVNTKHKEGIVLRYQCDYFFVAALNKGVTETCPTMKLRHLLALLHLTWHPPLRAATCAATVVNAGPSGDAHLISRCSPERLSHTRREKKEVWQHTSPYVIMMNNDSWTQCAAIKSFQGWMLAGPSDARAVAWTFKCVFFFKLAKLLRAFIHKVCVLWFFYGSFVVTRT